MGAPGLDEVVAARLGATSPLVRAWSDDVAIQARLARELAPLVARVGDLAFGSGYRDDVLGAGGRGPDDALPWAERVVVAEDGAWALTGIRFRGRDVERPFVEVVASSVPPSADRSPLADAVAAAYARFEPLALQCLVPTLPPGARIDQVVSAGRIDDLRRRPGAASYDRVALRPGEPARCARRAAGLYAALGPEHALWAWPEPESSLAECGEQDLLFEVVVDERAVGVVALAREERFGLAGPCVRELVLDADHRGRGLAVGVLQRAVDRVRPADGADDGEALWGTIAPDNLASRRNARSVGREEVAVLAWLAPPGWPGMPEI